MSNSNLILNSENYKIKDENYVYFLKLSPANKESKFTEHEADIIRGFIQEFNKIEHKKNKKTIVESCVSVTNERLTIEIYLSSEIELNFPIRSLRLFTNLILNDSIAEKFVYNKKVFEILDSSICEKVSENEKMGEELLIPESIKSELILILEELKKNNDLLKEISFLTERNNILLQNIERGILSKTISEKKIKED